MVETLGKRLWLGCDACQYNVIIAPHELADRHALDMQTPLLTLSRVSDAHALFPGARWARAPAA
jgi:hypothetical protein